MKTKKHAIILCSILCEFILQQRNSASSHTSKKLTNIQEKVSSMHRNHSYSNELYLNLIDKPQYGIDQKITLKEVKILKNISVIIHFKLNQKLNSNITYIESWLVAIQKNNRPFWQNNVDCQQELTYLLQQTIIGLKSQFLTIFSNMGQQLRSKYILDYEVEVNPSKKSLRRLYPLNYKKVWKKQAFLDQNHILSVTCHHNTHRKLQDFINKRKEYSQENSYKTNPKHGSEQTKPSNSGEYYLSTSTEQKGNQRQNHRKASMIQFQDDDLNITVLSNDSETFKKSTGRIIGVYSSDDFSNEKEQQNFDSDDEFQLLIEQDDPYENSKMNQNIEKYPKIKSIEKDICIQLFEFDLALNAQSFNL